MLEDLILQIVLSVHSEKILRQSIHLLLRCYRYLQKYYQFVIMRNIIEHIHKFIPISRKCADKLLRNGKCLGSSIDWTMVLWKGNRQEEWKGKGRETCHCQQPIHGHILYHILEHFNCFSLNKVIPRSIFSSFYRTCPGAATLIPDCAILAVYIFISFRNLSLSLCCSWK